MLSNVNKLYKLHREVNEEFVKAELERCKRKAGGKRKFEEMNEEGERGKLPKLKKETPMDEQEKENPENQQEKENLQDRLKKNDGLKEKSETSEVIKNLVATYLLL